MWYLLSFWASVERDNYFSLFSKWLVHKALSVKRHCIRHRAAFILQLHAGVIMKKLASGVSDVMLLTTSYHAHHFYR